MNELNYKEVFETLVNETAKYVTDNNIKAMILGISGGIDSTVVAAICYEVSILTGVPLIGRSLPTHFNKVDENDAADLVGKAFCTNYNKIYMEDLYQNTVDFINIVENDCQTLLANGNIQARLRMIYLYNLASIYNGIVMDTDNLTEHNLGYWTLHGDVGDFNPIGGLWKTEVFKLAEWYKNDYVQKKIKDTNDYFESGGMEVNGPIKFRVMMDDPVYKALTESLKLKPTAGLGITNNDLEELGAESYDQVDSILQEILCWKWVEDQNPSNPEECYRKFMEDQQMLNIPIEVIQNVAKRHFYSSFKRKKLPIKIERHLLV